jgi:hypothetical protein
MRIVAAITDHASIKRYLDGVGLPSEVPEVKPARPPPQMDFEDLAEASAEADEYTDHEYADDF